MHIYILVQILIAYTFVSSLLLLFLYCLIRHLLTRDYLHSFLRYLVYSLNINVSVPTEPLLHYRRVFNRFAALSSRLPLLAAPLPPSHPLTTAAVAPLEPCELCRQNGPKASFYGSKRPAETASMCFVEVRLSATPSSPSLALTQA